MKRLFAIVLTSIALVGFGCAPDAIPEAPQKTPPPEAPDKVPLPTPVQLQQNDGT